MMTPEQAFSEGAKRMQAHIVVWLTTHGQMGIAPMILGLPVPPYAEPENMEL
ncbi:hypothetical protein LCGC14_1326120 [marine sediment metagenome]|uniref:Uncharacterized protein n=1 Tax=marine sediment metagenome TaxID=412755 RepID=A0A0F9L3Y7_9ZZZZ